MKPRSQPGVFSELPWLKSLTCIKNLKTFSRRKDIFLPTTIAFPDLHGEFKYHKNKSSFENICHDFLMSYFKIKSSDTTIFMFQGRLKGPPLEFPFWPKSIRPRYIPFNCQPSIKVVLVSFIRKLRRKIWLQCDSSFMWDPETKNGE